MNSDNNNQDGTMSFFAHAREYRSFLSWARMRTHKNSVAQLRIKRGSRKNCRLRNEKQGKDTPSFIFLKVHVPGIFIVVFMRYSQ